MTESATSIMDMTAAALLRDAFNRGDRPAFRSYGDGRWTQATWREFARMAAFAARTATGSGLGEPVLVSIDNSIQSLAALTGLLVAGIDCAVLEADSPLLSDERAPVHRIGATTVIATSGALRHYTTVSPADLTGGGTRDAFGIPEIMRSGNCSVYQITSGTTGEPRLARQSMANLLRGGLIYARLYRVTSSDRLFLPIPAAHSFGLVGGLMCALVSGAALDILTRYSARGARDAIESGAVVMLGTPLVYELMTRSRRPTGGCLRAVLSSGGPLEAQLAHATERWLNGPVYQVYGSTEAGIIASQFPRSEPWPEGSVGLPAPGVELSLARGSGTREEGSDDRLAGSAELFIRSSTMFSGYAEHEEPALDPDGWFRTGDMACIDQEGHLTLVHRKNTFVNVGGRKVNPSRVERVISAHDAVREVAVYGVKTSGGEETRAVIALAAPCPTEALLAYCRERLAPYEVPYKIHVVSQLPRNGMGKVDRSRLPG